MDVGDPSNMERLRGLLGDADELREQLSVVSVSDEQIKTSIKQDFVDFGFATCPHTATATHVWRHLASEQRAKTDWVLVATAHPAKFETIVEPLIETTIPLPPELKAILSRPSHSVTIAPSLNGLTDSMRDRFFNI